MLNWSKISTVLLDMDGTILDLHFDNYFWLHHLPLRYSESAKISLEQAKENLAIHYEKVVGTIDWYCLDYWAEQTKLPIQALKREVQHLISLRCDAHDFMVALRESGREIILVTNAHPDSLLLKIELTQLDKYFDVLYSTHDFGVTKESQLLWERLQGKQGFDLGNTLFVDDSINILESAQQYGFEHLLAVENPDSQKATRTINSFPSTSDFRTLIDEIRKNPIK
ncbi:MULTISPECIES: GMP/IMP nucleotidase [unclassified Colwellia]|uniref:GMP/IMP nucleotidase n=1 Tax=unclassified Colwellia TaxID=196834 RepID=UPI0015F73176|nr:MULTISPECIES: GMP/IMP nucleotidase [unclassified Colwellia]MBA6232840.1 GMP/IMP nucleotidase [Colwellia sp. MB02u-7]MBA6236067.1 GMP/IMP nucleotidase [Colwellia sp. MB02u-11]MBA6256679.1 GMP/IMP nucleotidase [Colwellia sp. MB3u-28]MBA6261394.1 GMP/IMP nucleotidase [Colwellia sp. MB3u-41]MBA6298528.1 GMP/IMP nucleotidase [Colwellia sp. MB3u-22]